MQSIRQYRRQRRVVEQFVNNQCPGGTGDDKDWGHTAGDGPGIEPPGEKGPASGPRPQTLTLRDGRTLRIPGVRVHGIKGSVAVAGQGGWTEAIFLVGFDGPDDAADPKNWPAARRWTTLAIVGATGLLVGWASAVDSGVVQQARHEFGVGEVAETLATSLYLVSLSVFSAFIAASAVAPSLATQLVFRFFAVLFGCTTLTTFGGNMADLFDPLGRTVVFPVCCCLSFLGPFLAPLAGALIGQSSVVSWRWAEWSSPVMAAAMVVAIALFVPETYGPVLPRWRTAHLRAATGDDRFVCAAELGRPSLAACLLRSCSRPFALFFGELVVALLNLYLSVVYAAPFGFLTGYTAIYGDTFGFSQRAVGLAFIGINIGFLVALAMVPHIYGKYRRALARHEPRGADGRDAGGLAPEQRLWYAMYGAPWLPAALLFMAWTSLPAASPWPSLVASVALGFSAQGIFISTYQYLIDAYDEFAASALVSATFVRYVVAGVMAVASVPMYANLGVHWALTLLGCLSLAMTPVPYVLYRHGHVLRRRSSVSRTCMDMLHVHMDIVYTHVEYTIRARVYAAKAVLLPRIMDRGAAAPRRLRGRRQAGAARGCRRQRGRGRGGRAGRRSRGRRRRRWRRGGARRGP